MLSAATPQFLIGTVGLAGGNFGEIARLDNGTFAVIWGNSAAFLDSEPGFDDGETTAIVGRILDAQGNSVGGPFQVNTTTAGAQGDARVTALDNGNFVVTWTDGPSLQNFTQEARAQIFAADGSKLGAEILLNTVTEGDQRIPEVVARDGGGFIAMWQDDRPGFDEALLAQRFAADGSRDGPEMIAFNSADGVIAFDFIRLSDGSYRFYTDDNFATDGSDRQIAGYDYLDWQDVGPSFRPFAQIVSPTVTAPMTNGRYAVAGVKSTGDEVLLVVHDGANFDNFALIATTDPVNDTTLARAGDPNIALFGTADGGLLVAWAQATGDPASPNYDIMAQYYDAGLQKVGGNVLVHADVTGQQTEPFISQAADGRVLIGWTSDTRDQGGLPSDLYGRFFTLGSGGPSPDTPTAGPDSLTGDAGADSIDGLGGDDTLAGLGGDDTLLGSAGDDLIHGGAGFDRLEGGDGDDTVWGDDGRDLVFLGAGADVFRDNVQGGELGRDTVWGGLGNDTIQGGNADDEFHGQVGDDSIYGRFGNDLIFGDDGFDWIDAGVGDDTVWGGNGRDLAFLGDGADIFHDNAQGGALGRDTVFGNQGNDTIQGGNADDEFHGQVGDDSIYGRFGNDLIFGGDGFDWIDAGPGRDTVWGGNGRDLAFLGDGADIFHDNAQGGALGRDTVFGNQGNDTIQGGNADDEFHGQVGDDSIYGRFGNDLIFGGTGFDWIDAGPGDDTVWGGPGRDRIFLGAGDDRYQDSPQGDGLGQDTITGGSGADAFVFTEAPASDVITDYEVGVDSLGFTAAFWATRSLTVTGDGVLIDFGAGQSVLLAGLTDTAGIEGDVFFV